MELHCSSLQWRHNGHDGILNHWHLDCLINRLFRRRSKETTKFHVTGLCEGNSPVTGEFPAKGPVTQKMFPFDDMIMYWINYSETKFTYLQIFLYLCRPKLITANLFHQIWYLNCWLAGSGCKFITSNKLSNACLLSCEILLEQQWPVPVYWWPGHGCIDQMIGVCIHLVLLLLRKLTCN